MNATESLKPLISANDALEDVNRPASSITQSINHNDSEEQHTDMCRVCRSEGTVERPLYYPCLCTGSIKYVHQECLMQWLKYSKKEFCELCNFKYSFQPIYRADMPRRLPVSDVVLGVGWSAMTMMRTWCLYTIVAVAWLGLVPLTACRIYTAIFSGSVTTLLLLPVQLLSLENVFADCARGCLIVSVFLCSFICLIWLREQIIHGGPQHWLNLDTAIGDRPAPVVIPAEQPVQDDIVVDDEIIGEQDGAIDADQVVPPLLHDDENDGEREQEEEVEGGEGMNWAEWGGQRVADELTWERLLGLDGSLVFLEHVFWVISLNTFFTIVFAFSPYHIGNMATGVLNIREYLAATKFAAILTALIGYFCICTAIYIMHRIMRLCKIRIAHRATGLSYLVLKVFLLVLIEIGLFPLMCGCWLDICSLPLFSTTLSNRLTAFSSAPVTSTFIHWLVGMVYVFYFASFILILREVLRPGLLWFLRNLNDPEFNPIQEMIQLPVLVHMRRLLASTCLFWVTILLVVYIPICVTRKLLPTILPYNISLSAETPLSELSLELLLLQVLLPALLEQSQARLLLKQLVYHSSLLFSRLLQLNDYLLSDQYPAQDAAADMPVQGGLAAEHQALLLIREPSSLRTYTRPRYLPVKIVILLICLAVTVVFFSFLSFVLPVAVGRATVGAVTGHQRVHELYTISVGLYVLWLCLKVVTLLVEWIPFGWNVVVSSFKRWTLTGAKVVLAGAAVLGLVPLLLGTCFQLVAITPLRVGKHQSPFFFHWQDWAMGILHCKIVCAAVMMGPDWWLKTVFERLYQDGLHNLNLTYLYTQLVLTSCRILGLAIAVPYILANAIATFLEADEEERVLFVRHCYPSTMLVVCCLLFILWQLGKIKSLAQSIRNEKYLVGTRLVNYERTTETTSI